MQLRNRKVKPKTTKTIEETTPINMSTVKGFYDNYHGHEVHKLVAVHDAIRQQKLDPEAGIVFLAGDSSLDNKFWLRGQAPACNGMELILDPPQSSRDIAHMLNKVIEEKGMRDKMTVLNGAIEESTVGNRACMNLMPQDRFIREHTRENDTIILSVGGNDIALHPSPCTILNTCCLLCCTTEDCLKRCAVGVALPCDDYLCGCTTGCLSNLCAWPCGYGYFLHMFHTRVQSIARRLAGGPHPPKRILVCMIYYLDEQPTGSWADTALAALGYNKNPGHLQSLIRLTFEHATRRISVPGVEVIAVPLFVAMDGSRSSMYVQRVEPSEEGGKQMADLLMDVMLGGTEAVDRRLEVFDQRSRPGKGEEMER